MITTNTLVKIILLAQEPNVSPSVMKYQEKDVSTRYYS